MNSAKQLVSVLTTILTIFVPSVSQAASYPENPVQPEARQTQFREALKPPLPWNKQFQMYLISSNGSPVDNPSRIWGRIGGEASILCEQLDSNCLSKAESFDVLSYFFFCEKTDSEPCIDKLEYKTPDQDWQTAEFLRYVDYTPTAETIQKTFDLAKIEGSYFSRVLSAGRGVGWKPNKQWKLPGSATGPALFRMPGAMNPMGTDTYSFSGRLTYSFSVRGNKPTDVRFQNVDMSIRSYLEKDDSTIRPPVEAIVADSAGIKNFGGFGTGGDSEVAWTEEGRRAWAVSFDPDIAMRLTMKLPSKITGWFHGRLSDSSILVSKASSEVNRVVITGKSVQVPITSAWWEKYAPENRELLKLFNEPKSVQDADRLREAKGQGGLSAVGWAPGGSIDDVFYKTFSKRFPEAAKGEAQTWYVGSLPNWETSKSPCLTKTDSLQGLITTNAMVYQPGLPDYKNGYLNYRVAGVHLDKNGLPAKGNYELIMRSDVARCLYGFSRAPISGSITVLDANGQNEVSTTTIGEKNGWLKLTALNFGFSTKTIKVKLTQKKTTITCVAESNPKKTKKVSGYSPKCPAGYKKK